LSDIVIEAIVLQGEVVKGYQILREVEKKIPTNRALEVLSVKAQVNRDLLGLNLNLFYLNILS
jgi:hypothetical protein